ncbi:MAG: 50S ribosomal protein L4 [Candidatus Omnitrophica bacterium]|nr:50S ribosomal protein L4 [Candidatus Omnitrophota bacterium]
MSKLAVLDNKGKETASIDLPENVFGKHVNTAVIYQAVLKYRASSRQGTVSTKERADVSGGGKKPYRQKGTGRARAGSTRSPLWVGGGTTFGPHPRDFGYDLPKKIKKSALKEALNAKYQGQDLVCIADIKDDLTKTKEFAQIIKALNLGGGKVLAALDGSNESINRVTKNIPFFNVVRADDLNAYDVLSHKKVLVTKTALEKILERIQK